jgi:drug/metabolite transporter (DMT)-like permease
MTKHLPAAAAAATGILVGAAIVATRFVIGQASPAALALLRYAIGFACLLPWVMATKRVAIERRDLLPIGLLGIAQFGVVITLLNYALRYIPSGRAALIFATSPLLTLLFAAALGHERVTPAKALGVMATILGVGFVRG